MHLANLGAAPNGGTNSNNGIIPNLGRPSLDYCRNFDGHIMPKCHIACASSSHIRRRGPDATALLDYTSSANEYTSLHGL